MACLFRITFQLQKIWKDIFSRHRKHKTKTTVFSFFPSQVSISAVQKNKQQKKIKRENCFLKLILHTFTLMCSATFDSKCFSF